MSFEAYLRNIEAKTGTTPAQFRRLAAAKGFATPDGLAPGVKAGQVVAWLRTDFGLGHGHAMAIVALLKGPAPPASVMDGRSGMNPAG